MRVLFVTSHYPPSDHGWGLMQLCEEVADGLLARGHAVCVLTSTYGSDGIASYPYPVHRELVIDPDWHSGRSAMLQFFVGRRSRERQAVAYLRQLVTEFRPDVVFAWDTTGLPKPLLAEAENLPSAAMAYYLAAYQPEMPDEYVAYWQSPPLYGVTKWIKRPLAKVALSSLAREGKPVILRYENVACVSDYLRRRMVSKGLISDRAVVIHNGLDLSNFSAGPNPARKYPSVGLRCLIAGRVVPDKGIHTVLEALRLLQTRSELDGISLTILGDGPVNYMHFLRELVEEARLQDSVTFQPPIPRGQMPDVLSEHDILILASEYPEPLARSMQEGMAMGLLVVGTTTGGSGELLEHEKTGLVFEPADSESLARQLKRVMGEPDLAARLAGAGKQRVKQDFSIERTIEQTEEFLSLLVRDTGEAS